jgi:hypothetical protein
MGKASCYSGGPTSMSCGPAPAVHDELRAGKGSGGGSGSTVWGVGVGRPLSELDGEEVQAEERGVERLKITLTWWREWKMIADRSNMGAFWSFKLLDPCWQR